MTNIDEKVINTERCQHRRLEGSVHEIILGEPSRQTVDDWMRCLYTLFELTPLDEPVHTLIDATIGMQPLSYTMRQITPFGKRYANTPRPESRMALLYEKNFLTGMVDAMIASAAGRNRGKIRLFEAAKRDEALAWLRSAPLKKPDAASPSD